jgi:NAD(P)-dependent dehydrogenase (short-subunit alcohol dehydrogenase family)
MRGPVRLGSWAWAPAAGTIAFLAGDDSGYITAAALPLDGGITEAFTVPE